MIRIPPSLYPRLAAALLALACAGSAALWGQRLLASRGQARAPTVATRPDTERVAAAASRLFGEAPAAAAQAPESYRLLGVIGGGARAGAALIQQGSQPARVVAAGAEIAPGVRLVDTSFGGAVLLRDGVRSPLRMPRTQAGPGPAAATASASGDEPAADARRRALDAR